MTYQTTNIPPVRGHISTRRSLEILREKLQDWGKRRDHRIAYRKMMQLDDRILRDIGVTRYQVNRAANAPLSQNIQLTRQTR